MSASLRVVPRPSLMEGLIADRAALAHSLNDSRAAAARVRTAEAEEAEIIAQIGKMGADHIAAIREWAKAGGKGDMPAADIAETARLAQRLAAAQAGAAAATGALAELDAASVTIAADLRTIDARIADAALSDAIATIPAMMERAHDFARQASAQVAEAFGVIGCIRGRGATLQSQGRSEDAAPFFRAAERAEAGIAPFNVEPAPADIMAHSEAWRAKLAEMTGGVFA